MATPSLLTKPSITLDSGKQYWVQNNTPDALTLPDGRTPLFRYARIDYPLAPGEKTIVPFDIISLYFGDPRSRNGMIQKFMDSRGEGVIPTREAELGRIAVFWGVYEDGVDRLANVCPDVTFSTLEGFDIVPPCFDPFGDHVYGFEKNTDTTQSGVAATIESMQTQIDQLMAMQSAMSDRGQDNDVDVEEDLPTTP